MWIHADESEYVCNVCVRVCVCVCVCIHYTHTHTYTQASVNAGSESDNYSRLVSAEMTEHMGVLL